MIKILVALFFSAFESRSNKYLSLQISVSKLTSLKKYNNNNNDNRLERVSGLGLAHGELKIIAFNKRNYVWHY